MNRFIAAAFAAVSLLFVVPASTSADVPAGEFLLDGEVYEVVRHGQHVYLAGAFDRQLPVTSNAGAYTAAGEPAAALPDVIGGEVKAIEPDGAGGWYLGGTFTHVGAVKQPALAHVKANGTLDLGWAPQLAGGDRSVAAIVVGGDGTVYAGGSFETVGGRSFGGVVALGPDGEPRDWPGLRAQGTGDGLAAVNALALADGRLYVGGTFRQIRTTADSAAPYDAGTWTQHLRDRIAAVDLDGEVVSWNPGASGNVNAIAVTGDDVYLGGTFAQLAGTARRRLGAVSASAATATTWNPAGSTLGNVNALALDGSTLYVGGAFTASQQIGGQNRAYAAAVDRATGVATAWAPVVSNPVKAIEATGDDVYLAGEFTTAGAAQTRIGVAGFAKADGALLPWSPGFDHRGLAISAAGGTIAVGGEISYLGEPLDDQAGLVRLDLEGDLDTDWNAQSNGDLYGAAIHDDTLYAVGSFSQIGGQPRTSLAAIDTETATATDWQPQLTPANGANAMTIAGDRLFVAGTFTAIDGQSRMRVAEFDLGTGALTEWNPGAAGATNWKLKSTADDMFLATSNASAAETFARRYSLGSSAPTLFEAFAPIVTRVRDIAVGHGRLYVAGTVEDPDGTVRDELGAVDVETGALVDWDPQPDSFVSALSIVGDVVYASGSFSSIAGQPRSGLAAIHRDGTLLDWTPEVSGGFVRSIDAEGSLLRLGGRFQIVEGRLSPSFAALIHDVTAPEITVTVPTEGQEIVQGEDIESHFGCTGEPYSTPNVLCDAPATVDASQLGSRSFTVEARDQAGNESTRTVAYTVVADEPDPPGPGAGDLDPPVGAPPASPPSNATCADARASLKTATTRLGVAERDAATAAKRTAVARRDAIRAKRRVARGQEAGGRQLQRARRQLRGARKQLERARRAQTAVRKRLRTATSRRAAARRVVARRC